MYKAFNNGWTLAGLIFCSWIVASGLFAIIEDVNGIDPLYWAMTTMSTVGYGDLSAQTTGGKILSIAFQAWSIFMLVPCAVAHVIDKIRRDEDKFTHAEQEWQENALLTIANKVGATLPTPPADTNYKE